MTVRRACCILLAVCSVLAWSALPANAHYLKSGWVRTYDEGGDCSKVSAELSHDVARNPGGYYYAGVESWANLNAGPYGNYNCQRPRNSQKKWQLRIWKWIGPTLNDWALCKDTGVHLDTVESFRVFYEANQGKNAPCGPGLYTSHALGWNLFVNAWRGGTVGLRVYSPQEWYHDLPDNGVGGPGGLQGQIPL